LRRPDETRSDPRHRSFDGASPPPGGGGPCQEAAAGRCDDPPACIGYGFPRQGLPADAVRSEIASLCQHDHWFEGGSIYNSICTQPLDLASEVFARFAHTNLGDNRIFPGLRQAEAQVTRMLGALLRGPGAWGGLTSGGTESNLLAMLAAVRAFERRSGKAREQMEILMPASAHYSFDKVVTTLGVRASRAQLTRHFRVDVADLARRINAETAAIVVTAGTSECGAVDDVAAVARIAAERGVWLHVDAATGGFLIPFLEDPDAYPFDFRLPEVTSVTLDPHKYGYAPVPAGYLLVRAGVDPALLEFPSHYRGTSDQMTLLGTRPGAAILAVYACLRGFGLVGYRHVVGELIARRDQFIESLARHGFDLAFKPDLTIVGIEVDDPALTLAQLERRGLIASASKRFGFLRVVIQRHLSSDDLAAFVAELVGCCRVTRGQP
jgi:tyrosine decarboxylase/aspartate 1-decarboxylase